VTTGAGVEKSADLTNPGPLRSVRVLELGDRLGAYCGKVLADLGAEVIKIERPGGDPLRFSPPFRLGQSGPEAGLNFAYYHHNKRGITLDWSAEESWPLLRELGRTAKVIITSPTARQPVVGFDPASGNLSWASTDSIACFITPFGLTGPYRDWRATPFVSYAMSGLMHDVGPAKGPPVAQPGQQQYDECGIHAAVMVQALLHRPDLESQYIDISAHEVGWFNQISLDRYGRNGWISTRRTSFGIPPAGIWRCTDGLLDIASHTDRHWDIFLEVMDKPEILMDPIYRDRAQRVQLFDLLTDIIAELFSTRSAVEIVETAQAAGLPCALMYTPSEFLEDAQHRRSEFFVESSRQGTGTFEIPGRPFRTEPDLISYRKSAPLLGEDNESIYITELGHSHSELSTWRANGLI
jgi:crotonobetainyl-CoA:carnitine CoA-transferase CaiB-like acyl-CoA transferase